MKTYKYIGDGAGVPGLPHEIPAEEAEGYGNPFKAALDAGLYQLIDARPERSEAHTKDDKPRKSKKADEPAEGD